MLDIKRWNILLLIIFFIVLIFIFTKCKIKCGEDSEPFGTIYSSLSSMGWVSGNPISYPDVEFGEPGLYYVEQPVNIGQAYPLANSLGGVIVGGNCIRAMLRKGALISDTPSGLLYSVNPTTSGMLSFGRLSNGNLATAGLIADGDAVGSGIFVYGPVPKDIGVPIYYDYDGDWTKNCMP